MIKIIIDNTYLLKSHMNGFDVCEVKKGKEAVVRKKFVKNGEVDDFSNFNSGTFHSNLSQALQKVKTLMITTPDSNTFEELLTHIQHADDIIKKIAEQLKLVL